MRVRVLMLTAALGTPVRVLPQDTLQVRASGDSVMLRFIDTDLRTIVRGIAPYLGRPIFAPEMPSARVTLETPRPVATSALPSLLRGLLQSHALTLQEDSAFYRIVAVAAVSAQALGAPLEQRLFVIKLKHARATQVALAVNQLYGTQVGDGNVGNGLSSGTLADELRRNRLPPQGGGVQPMANDVRSARGGLSGNVVLVPDERTNALLVRASASDLEVIRTAVDQLDVRALQVLIEVMVVEVRKDRSFDLSGAGSVKETKDSRVRSAALSSANPGALVLQFMQLSRADVSVRLSAATSRGDAKIVSKPVLVVANNAEARFLVGAQRPFVQVSRSLPTDVPTRDQVIQYRDVGTKLTVRPSISEDGFVSLLVQQEMSSATDETQFGAPVISTREASTEVLARDGQTLVLGGLTDTIRTRSRSGIPVLSWLPFVGGLFGESRQRTEATEIFLFLTPHVIRTDQEADSLTRERQANLGRKP